MCKAQQMVCSTTSHYIMQIFAFDRILVWPRYMYVLSDSHLLANNETNANGPFSVLLVDQPFGGER